MSQGPQPPITGGAPTIPVPPTVPPTAPINPILNTTESILTIPLVGNKKAPKKFTGDYREVSRFIRHFEKLCQQHNITSDQDKCDTIRLYCSTSVVEFIEGLKSFIDGEWDTLKKDLEKYYDAALYTQRFKKKDLTEFVKKTKYKRMGDLAAWWRYARDYIKIGGWLKGKDKITEDELNTYFWAGIGRGLRSRIETRLLASQPTKDTSKPYTMKEISEVAERILQREKFDEFVESDDSDEFGTDWSGDSESSTEESTDEDIRVIEARKAKAERKKKESRKKVRYEREHRSRMKEQRSEEERRPKRKSTPPPSAAKLRQSEQQDEVEELIKQMSKMNINDPTYGLVYYRAIKLDPAVAAAVRAPRLDMTPPSLIPDRRAPIREAPPHMTSGTSQPNFPPARPPVSEMVCFGCGEKGHGTMNCAKVADLIKEGLLARDITGRLTHGNGARIQRFNGEFIIQAAERGRGQSTRTNLITIDGSSSSQNNQSYHTAKFTSDLDSESDSETDSEEEIYMVEQTEGSLWDVYPVERTEKTLHKKRKMEFDGVYPPPRNKGQAKEKQKEREEIPRPIEVPRIPGEKVGHPQKWKGKDPERRGVQWEEVRTRKEEDDEDQEPVSIKVPRDSQAMRRNQEADGSGSQPIVPDRGTVPRMMEPKRRKIEVTPVEEPMRFNPNDDEDFIMEDDTIKEDKIKKATTKKRAPRQSVISTIVDPIAVLGQILRSPVQLPVGDILGSSKELANLLTKNLRPVGASEAEGKSLMAKKIGNEESKRKIIKGTYEVERSEDQSHRPLIKIPVEINGVVLEGIFDTGSNINIISKEAWKRAVRWPMNVKKGITMRDANGGEGYLPGLLTNVPLQCGDIHTRADLFVAPHVSFELLLGRAWQETNLVALDELRDGTYLLFKDPADPDEILHQFFVGPRRGPSVGTKESNGAAKNARVGQVNNVKVEKGNEKEDSPDDNDSRAGREEPGEIGSSREMAGKTENELAMEEMQRGSPNERPGGRVSMRERRGEKELERKKNAISTKTTETKKDHSPALYTMSGTTRIQLEYLQLVESIANLPLPSWESAEGRSELESVEQALRDFPALDQTGRLYDQILSSPFSITLDTGVENGHPYHTSLMLHAVQFASSVGRPFSLRIGHSFVKTYFGIDSAVPRPVEYPFIRSQVLFYDQHPRVNGINDVRSVNGRAHEQEGTPSPPLGPMLPVIQAPLQESPIPSLELPGDEQLAKETGIMEDAPFIGPVPLRPDEPIGSLNFRRLLERVEELKRRGGQDRKRKSREMEGEQREEDEARDESHAIKTIDPRLAFPEPAPYHPQRPIVESYTSTPAPPNSREASVLLVGGAQIHLVDKPGKLNDGSARAHLDESLIQLDKGPTTKRRQVPHVAEENHALVNSAHLNGSDRRPLEQLLGAGISSRLQLAFVPSIPDPVEFATEDGCPRFERLNRVICVAGTGEMVARMDEPEHRFPNARYLSDISHVHPVTLFELGDPSAIGYSQDMTPNIPIFPFIHGASYLPALGNATIAVIVFWRRRIQELALRVKKNIEDRDEQASEEELIGKDVEVFIELKKPCVRHLLDTPGNHSDYTSLLVHPHEWNPLFTTEEGAFLRTTIDYFKTVGRFDFAEALRTLLGLHFADDHIIRWLVDSHLADPARGTNPDLYDNSFRQAEGRAHALILRDDPWYSYPGENSSEISETN